jgi:hypothetical protein
MMKPEWYLKIRNEDEIKISEERATALKSILVESKSEFVEINDSLYKARDVEYVKKIMVNYA